MGKQEHYSRLEIERYLTHKMTRQEMHAFETAMMNDPLLADATEGFHNADKGTSTHHLNVIKSEILSNEQPSRILSYPSRTKNWLKIAAVFIVVAAIGLVTYNRMEYNKSEYASVSNETAALQLQVDSNKPAEILPADSGMIATLPAPKRKIDVVQPPFVTNDPSQNKVMADRTMANDSMFAAVAPATDALAMQNEAARVEAIESERSIQAASAAKTAEAAPHRLYRIKGRLVDQDGEPLRFATIVAVKGHGAVSDADGSFTLMAPDSTVKVSIEATGYQSFTTTVNNNTNNKIIARQSDEALSEVVVTALGKSKPGKNSHPSEASPRIGWDKYHHYLRQSIEQLQDTAQTYEAGPVELSFLIDENGRPVDIKVKQYTNKQNRDYAIELLKKGSKWKPSGEKRTTILIEF